MWCVHVVGVVTFAMGGHGTEILVVSDKGINMYNTTSGLNYKVMPENDLMIKEVDYHYARDEIYGLTKRQILRCQLSPSSTFEYRPVVYSEDEYNFMSMAVDWVHDTLYWTAGPVFMIHRALLNGTNHEIIYRGYYIENFHKKMLIDPYAGLLFWSTSSKLYSADLEGNNLQEIKFPEVLGTFKSRVRNLAVDVTRQRIYFLAGFEDDDVWMMMSGNYDGSGFRRHESVSRFTYAIAAMGDEIFWIAKEFVRTTYSPGGFPKTHSLMLYKASTQLPGTMQHLMDLNIGAVWNMRVCDPKFQKFIVSQNHPEEMKRA